MSALRFSWILAGLLVAPAAPALPGADGGPRPGVGTGVLGGHAAWSELGLGAVRGVTVGPIESSLHPASGYGTARGRAAFAEARRLGATWVSLTVFGRVWDLQSTGVDPTFEAPLGKNRADVRTAIRDAHAEGLRVMLVPHLWVESGGWRAELDPGSTEGWERWARSYRAFVLDWASVAEEGGADIFSVGVELRSWVTTSHAPSFAALVREVRARYRGLVTYAANWDDVTDTVVLGELDLIGVNAFHPLTDREGAGVDELLEGAAKVVRGLEELAASWQRPVLLTEMGYTTRPDPARRPWEWPDGMRGVRVDQEAQADAYLGLLGALQEAPSVIGFFVWRTYADPNDQSQEAEWGFSPRGKLAEGVLRAAFSSHFPADGPRPAGSALGKRPIDPIGVYARER